MVQTEQRERLGQLQDRRTVRKKGLLERELSGVPSDAIYVYRLGS